MDSVFINPAKFNHCHCASITKDSSGREWIVFYCYEEMETKRAVLAVTSRKDSDWDKPTLLREVEGCSLGNPVIWEASPGHLVLIYSVIESGYWDTASLRVIELDINNRNKAPTRINTPPGHLVRHPPIKSFDGTFILPFYDEVTKTSYLAKNTNEAMSSWELIYSFPEKDIIQGQILRLKDRSLLIFFRPMGERKTIYFSRSRDDGYTWDAIKDTHLHCPQSGISACSNGYDVFLIYNNTTEHQRFPLSYTRGISPFSFWSQPTPIDQMRFEVSYPQFFIENDTLKGVYTYNRKMIKSVELSTTEKVVSSALDKDIKIFRNRHHGKSVFILASGPSLDEVDLTPLSRRITIGLNRSFLKYPDTYYHCMFDQRLFEEFEDQLKDHRCLFTLQDRPWGIPIKNLGAEGFATELENGIYTGYTIAYFALQIAVYMGFKKVFFLGLDLQNKTGKTHFFGFDHHSANHETSEFPKMIRAFENCKVELEKLGVTVYNCNTQSKLTAFPQLSLKQAISIS